MEKKKAELKEIREANTFLGKEMGAQHVDYEGYGYATDTAAAYDDVGGYGDDDDDENAPGETGLVAYADENAIGEEAMMDASNGEIEANMAMGGALEMYNGGA